MNNKSGGQALAEAILDALWAKGFVSTDEAKLMKEYCEQKLK